MATVMAALFWLGKLVVQGAIRWREYALQNLVSCLLIILTFPLAVLGGQAIRTAVFSHEIGRWHNAVAWVATHSKPNQESRIELPSLYSDLAYGVHYRHDDACGLTIDFFWGAGFPVKHTVRRYAVDPEWINIKECQTGWSRGRMISERWYELSD